MKERDLFLKSGYLNVNAIMDCEYPFVFIIGARGIGKTYGILKYIKENGINSIIMRRTQVEVDIISNPAFHPYKKLCSDKGWSMTTKPVTKGVTGICEIHDDGETGGPFAYIAALSTFANLRGFDSSDVDLIYLDEFIPEPSKKSLIKNEFEALLNAYETVNRNRELEGKQPVKLICSANSNTIDNPYFIGLEIVNKIYSMQNKGKMIFCDSHRGLMVINLVNSPISRAKQETVLYKLSGSGNFSAMALSNEYSGYDDKRISNKENMIEYRPLFTVGEITMYKHKSKTRYYVSTHRRGAPDTYTASSDDIARCKNRYAFIVATAFYDDKILFEDVVSQILFCKYLL